MARPTETISPARTRDWTTVRTTAATASARGAPPADQERPTKPRPRASCSQVPRRNMKRLISPPRWRRTIRRASGETPASRAATSGRISAPRTRSAIRRFTPAMTQDATRSPSQKPARRTAERATLLVVEGVGRARPGVGLGALARLLELLVQDLPRVAGLLDGALGLLVELAPLALHAAHEVVGVLWRGPLLVDPHGGPRLGVHLEHGLAAGAGDVERFRHVRIVARPPGA